MIEEDPDDPMPDLVALFGYGPGALIIRITFDRVRPAAAVNRPSVRAHAADTARYRVRPPSTLSDDPEQKGSRHRKAVG